jgi:hypothetical protein
MTLQCTGNEEAVLDLFTHRAPSFLRKLRPDNMQHFATLFTAAVLQAAATGESFLDDELSRLANRDLSRFALLQDRLKVGPDFFPIHWAAAQTFPKPGTDSACTHTHTPREREGGREMFL